MESKTDTYYSHFSAFLLGVLLTGLFFVGATSEDKPHNVVIETDRAKALVGAVFFAGATENDVLMLAREEASFVFATTSAMPTTTHATSTRSATSTLQYGSGELFVEKEAHLLPAPKVIQKIILPVIAEEEIVEPTTLEERVLPEGVYVLGNGDYVDSSGAKISGDPYMYNYKPPQEEDNFTTPGGVVMNRFGVILHSPEVIDESKVLIPPTIIDIDNPPATVSPIYIPRQVTLAINQNPFLTCTQLQLYLNDKALCELFKTYEDDYQWIRVDLEE